MSWYLRKSVRVGGMRFNLSRSGVGMSVGVTGLRVGRGPRGNYVHMGRGGVYFRQTLSSASAVGPPRGHTRAQEARRSREPAHEPLMRDIEIVAASDLQASSADE